VNTAVKLAETDPQGLAASVLPLEKILERFLKVPVDKEVGRRLGNGQNLGPDSLSEVITQSLQNVTMVCFFLPHDGPVVLARVKAAPDGKPSGMKILRQIHLSH
jgi:hypothetical protein